MAQDNRDLTTTATAPAPHASAQLPAPGAVLAAVVDDISADGVPRVVLSGESHPRVATTILRFESAAAASAALLGQTVLVTIGPDDTPVIIGTVHAHLWDHRNDPAVAEVQAMLPAGQPVEAHVDRRRVDLQATDEIRLTCGKSTLVMKRDGTVVVRGVRIVTRATETNRIMGGTVGIN
ncbi:MAG: hypothetical protein QM736_28380 [Vicinamibacterales bacterium]